MSVEVNIQKQLDGFTLHVQLSAGDLPIALLGASGSGKSMTDRRAGIGMVSGEDHDDLVCFDFCQRDRHLSADVPHGARCV